MTEDEMAGWHHRVNGHEFGQTLGVGDGQGGLTCCDSCGHKKLGTAEQLNLNWVKRIDSLENTLMLGKIEGWKRRG